MEWIFVFESVASLIGLDESMKSAEMVTDLSDLLMVYRRKRGTDFELRVEAANRKINDFPFGKIHISKKK